VGLLGHTGSGPGGQDTSDPHDQQLTLAAKSSKHRTEPAAQKENGATEFKLFNKRMNKWLGLNQMSLHFITTSVRYK
jgi:hypothetical protein